MLSDEQLATVRAALQFWREEICPFGGDLAAPYYDAPVEKHLSTRQVLALERRFDGSAVRYLPYDRKTERIATPRLIADKRSARRLARDGFTVATVLIS